MGRLCGRAISRLGQGGGDKETMKYYYADAQNKTAGPVSLEELQALVKAGALKSDPMVVPDGGTEWKPLSAFTAKTAERETISSAFAPSQATERSNVGGSFVPFSRTILGDLVAVPLKHIKRWLSEEFVNRSLAFDRNAGHLAILAGGALGLIYCIVTAIRANQLIPALVGIGFIIALAIAQFVAMQFLSAGDALIASTPHRVSSEAFLECCGLFALLGGLGVLASGLLMGIALGGVAAVMTIIPSLINAVFLLYLAALALNPQVVNISIGSGGAGEEAVGILGFFLKAYLKLLPLLFFFVGIAGDMMIALSFFSRTQEASAYGANPFSEHSSLGGLVGFSSMFGGYGGIAMVLFACLLPFIGYLLFLLFNLGLEVTRAILSLTGKPSPIE